MSHVFRVGDLVKLDQEALRFNDFYNESEVVAFFKDRVLQVKEIHDHSGVIRVDWTDGGDEADWIRLQEGLNGMILPIKNVSFTKRFLKLHVYWDDLSETVLEARWRQINQEK